MDGHHSGVSVKKADRQQQGWEPQSKLHMELAEVIDGHISMVKSEEASSVRTLQTPSDVAVLNSIHMYFDRFVSSNRTFQNKLVVFGGH